MVQKEKKVRTTYLFLSGSFNFDVNVRVDSKLNNNGDNVVHVVGLPPWEKCDDTSSKSIPAKSIGYFFFSYSPSF